MFAVHPLLSMSLGAPRWDSIEQGDGTMAIVEELKRTGEARAAPPAALALVVALGWISPAIADAANSAVGERTVSGVRISLGEEGRRWTLVPTLLDGKVESFVALREDAPYGENLTAVWYRKIAAADGTGSWQTKAFDDQDQSKAIRAVKQALALADSTDESWPVAVAAVAAAEPEPMAKGLLESDALAPLVAELEDPQPIVEMLEDAGWQAAWIGPLEGVALATAEPDAVACSQAAVLTAVASGVETGSALEGALIARASLQLACLPGLCFQWTSDNRAAVPWGPWFCASWTLLLDAGWAPMQIAPCEAKAWYQRSVSRSKTFTVTHTSWNCTVTTWAETIFQTDTQRASCTYHYPEVGCDFARSTAPAVPCTSCGDQCQPGICGN